MRFNLSEITEVIQDRRTIFPEQYSDRKVAKEIVENIIRNATWAPNHGKTQPWRFSVFMNEGKQELQELMPNLYKKHTPEEAFMQGKFERIGERINKTSAIIVCWMQRDENEKISRDDEMLAVGCAIQNLMLSATAYGIGSFWSTPKFLQQPEFKDFIKMNEKDEPVGVIYLGYPNEEWPKAHRKPIEYVTTWR